MPTADNGFIYTGWVQNGGDNKSVLIGKVNATGDLAWQKVIDSDPLSSESGEKIQSSPDGGYIVVGYSDDGNKAYLLKLNAAGDTTWTQKYGGNGTKGRAVANVPGGGYLVTGEDNDASVNRPEIYFLCTDAAGKSLWSKSMAGTALGGGKSLQPTSDNAFLMAGYAMGSVGIPTSNLIKIDATGKILMNIAASKFPDINSTAFYGQEILGGGYLVIGGSPLVMTKTDPTGTHK